MTPTLLSHADVADKTGIEDVIRAVRELARRSRHLVEDAAGVAERRLAVALTAAEQMRDAVTSAKALEEARAQPVLARLRADAHRGIDLGMDFVATAYVFSVRAVEGFVDDAQPGLGSEVTGL